MIPILLALVAITLQKQLARLMNQMKTHLQQNTLEKQATI